MSIHDARLVAMAAHAGQKDKLGEPYMSHLERVVRRCKYAHESKAAGNTMDWELDARLQVAYLHDVVEDTPVGLGTLSAMGFAQHVIIAVEAITHMPHERTIDYYWRVSKNPLARYVKEHDVADNADPDRLSKISDIATRERLCAKYVNARAFFGWSETQ